MAIKKTDSGSSVKTSNRSKASQEKLTPKPVKKASEKSSEELVVDNFAAMSQVITSVSETLELLVQKTESMAFHIIATEEVLAEIVADNGLNIANVNARIRTKFAAGAGVLNDANRAIDVAASIASPLPR